MLSNNPYDHGAIRSAVSRHIRYRPCPVTSRISPRASIQARLRRTAARLAPVRVSAIGAETSGHSVSMARRSPEVFPESEVIIPSALRAHASISSSCRIAVRLAVSIPASQRAKRSAGGPPGRSPPAPPMARGAKTAPLPSLAEIRAAVPPLPIGRPASPSLRDSRGETSSRRARSGEDRRLVPSGQSNHPRDPQGAQLHPPGEDAFGPRRAAGVVGANIGAEPARHWTTSQIRPQS